MLPLCSDDEKEGTSCLTSAINSDPSGRNVTETTLPPDANAIPSKTRRTHWRCINCGRG